MLCNYSCGLHMRESRKFCQRGPNLITFFLVDEGIEDPNTFINGPPSTRQQLPFKWCFPGGPMIAQH